MKRLIICCDGTWNTPEQEENNLPAPSNVVRIFNAVADRDDQGVQQIKYYHTGVGTEGGLLERTAGGVAGEGLDKNIKSAYFWLGSLYEPGDAVYLFGFSRGAYTARCLGGMISRCGLLDLRGLSRNDPADAWHRVDTAYKKGYMKDQSQPDDWKKDEWAWHAAAAVPIEFIGVWDTVGARGIPDDLAVLNLFDDPDDWRFYDTRLGKHVKHARHAVAMDEMRASFTPTLWTGENDRPIYDDPSGRVKQLWFPGVHSDVGGGYSSNGLSDVALRWMIDEAAATGLVFQKGFVDQIQPDPRGVLHNSVKGLFKALRTRPRNVPDLQDATKFHPAAVDRHQNPPITQAPYHPTRKLNVGEIVSFSVYAGMHWNASGLYLERGASYTFTAEGEWLDRKIACGPKGTRDGKFQPAEMAHLVGSLFGKLEGAFQKITGNKKADFAMTKRLEKLPWFCLVGAIANDGLGATASPGADGSPTPHQFLSIGEGPLDVQIEQPGYLFAFANDAWHFYDNNRGSVTLTIKRSA